MKRNNLKSTAHSVGMIYLICFFMLISLLTGATDNHPAGNDLPKTVVKVLFGSSLEADKAILGFSRPGGATYFDINTNRIVAVPKNIPRFVEVAEKNLWGVNKGILLECGAENLLLDSSFEGNLSPWTFQGNVKQQKTIGIHGKHALKVIGPASITYKPISLKTIPAIASIYIASIYIRRIDGASINKGDIQCIAKPEGAKSAKAKAFNLARMGNGPWYRCSLPVRARGHNPTLYSITFQFREGEYIVDCAQLEWGWNRHSGPSSYIPTGEKHIMGIHQEQKWIWPRDGSTKSSTQRAHERLTCKRFMTKKLFPGKAWSYSFWTYVYPYTGGGNCFFLLSKGAVKMRTSRGYVIIGNKRANAYKFHPHGWLFITVTYDGTNMDVFYNGVHSPKGPFKVDSPSFDTACWSLGYNSPVGIIADFTTWNRALSTKQVMSLYKTSNPMVDINTNKKKVTQIFL